MNIGPGLDQIAGHGWARRTLLSLSEWPIKPTSLTALHYNLLALQNIIKSLLPNGPPGAIARQQQGWKAQLELRLQRCYTETKLHQARVQFPPYDCMNYIETIVHCGDYILAVTVCHNCVLHHQLVCQIEDAARAHVGLMGRIQSLARLSWDSAIVILIVRICLRVDIICRNIVLSLSCYCFDSSSLIQFTTW